MCSSQTNAKHSESTNCWPCSRKSAARGRQRDRSKLPLPSASEVPQKVRTLDGKRSDLPQQPSSSCMHFLYSIALRSMFALTWVGANNAFHVPLKGGLLFMSVQHH